VKVLPPMDDPAAGAGFAGLLLVLTTSILRLQTGVLPRWLAWLGIVVVIAWPFDVIYISIGPFLLWVLVASEVVPPVATRTSAPATSAGRLLDLMHLAVVPGQHLT
jgi:hypothetical protein